MNRRYFLQQSASLVAAGVAPRWARAAAAGRKQRIHIGAETNAFGVPIKPFSRLLEVVGMLSKLGYEGFETNVRALEAGASDPVKWRREFEARDIRLIAAFAGGGGLYNKEVADRTIERYQRIASFTAKMDAGYMIFNGPGLRFVDGKPDLGEVHNAITGLNRLGEMVQKEGLKLCVHNEWQPMVGHPSAESFILRDTDPKLVWLCYDVGNAYMHQLGLGPNPATFSQEYFQRIAIYHIKDVGLNSQGKPVNTELGAGRIDLKGVIAPLLNSGWEGWLTVEQYGNYPKGWAHPHEIMRQARVYMRKLTGV